MAYTKQLGNREWGISPSGERIYHTGYCATCKGKAYLCESEFKAMLDDVGWEITHKSVADIVRQKMKLPKIKVEWGGD